MKNSYPRLLAMLRNSLKNRTDLHLFSMQTKVLANFEDALYRAKKLGNFSFADSQINEQTFAGAVVALFEALPKEIENRYFKEKGDQTISEIDLLVSPASVNGEVGALIKQIEDSGVLNNPKYADIRFSFIQEKIGFEASYENSDVKFADQFLAKVLRNVLGLI